MNTREQNIIKIKVPNTKYWLLGEKISKNTWNIFLINMQTGYKTEIKKSISTRTFSVLSNVIFKTPLPYNK